MSAGTRRWVNKVWVCLPAGSQGSVSLCRRFTQSERSSEDFLLGLQVSCSFCDCSMLQLQLALLLGESHFIHTFLLFTKEFLWSFWFFSIQSSPYFTLNLIWSLIQHQNVRKFTDQTKVTLICQMCSRCTFGICNWFFNPILLVSGSFSYLCS